ncbi:PilT/PilU family type 4a pilus ATPase [Populibacterium corticicola]|uniref:PilT/PilU family type 4a pilus ATPase n=1 Tax=Populibacterium corticicola TaxID=1812826 RepID=A0ABW5XE40_9MICO
MTEQFLPQGNFPNPQNNQRDGSGAGVGGAVGGHGGQAAQPGAFQGAPSGSPFGHAAGSFVPGGQPAIGQPSGAPQGARQAVAPGQPGAGQPGVAGQSAGMQSVGAPIAPAAARGGESDYSWAQPSAAHTFRQEIAANAVAEAPTLGSPESARAVPPVTRTSARQPVAVAPVVGGAGAPSGSLPTNPQQSASSYAGGHPGLLGGLSAAGPQDDARRSGQVPAGVAQPDAVSTALPQRGPAAAGQAPAADLASLHQSAPVNGVGLAPVSATAVLPAPTGSQRFIAGGVQAPGGFGTIQPQSTAPATGQAEAPTRRGRGIVESDRNAGGRVGMSNSLRAGDLVIDEILREVVEHGASDLHLTNRSAPMLRKSGALTPLEGYDVLEADSLRRSVYQMLTQKQREVFEEKLELDFAYQVPGGSRFRVNMYQQRDSVGAAFRVIPSEIKPLEDLGVPPVVATFSKLPRGLVLVTGPTGSGKSTTLASIIDLANRTRPDHIMTVEDPIEFLHDHKKALVNQREVGTDTWSFAAALKHVLRQDPDIILVGEMRDLETISVALTAAETGHLVFATLHTQDAAQTIDRVIDVFPPEQQEQIRVQLASAIQGVVCQTLCKRANGPGRVVATEVMVATPGIRNLVREGKTHQIYSAMQAGKNQGMHTMDQHLADLVKTGAISYETGVDKCHHIEDFNRLAGRTGTTFNADVINGGM